jgi:hypothetical protein
MMMMTMMMMIMIMMMMVIKSQTHILDPVTPNKPVDATPLSG